MSSRRQPASGPRGATLRARAARLVHETVDRRRRLDPAGIADVSRARPGRSVTANDQGWLQEVVYGVTRRFWLLDAIAGRLVAKPFRPRDRIVHCLLLVGLYQLAFMRTAAHAAIHETVEASRRLERPWAAPVINAALRRFGREGEEIEARARTSETARLCHPAWLIDAVRRDWPVQAETVLEAGNERPPMDLRVNPRRTSREDYLNALRNAGIPARALASTEAGVRLERGVPVGELPGFAAGLASVQDESAQLVAPAVDAAPGHRVLDACAAPGGKTAHLLERAAAAVEVVAVEIDPARADALRATLDRLGLAAQVRVADAADPAAWWDGRPFERVLADVPCSATGVVRRHPDVKHRRRATDVAEFARAQHRLLDALWPTVAPGGELVYVTCSLLEAENAAVVGAFLRRHADARELVLDEGFGLRARHGRQRLPGVHGGDGFYYAKLARQ